MRVSITDFGAVPGSGKLQTEAIQKAIDNVFLKGGGEVEIPEGKFLSGGIRLRSNVTLHLLSGAYLLGSRDPEDYFILENDKIEPFPARLLSEETREGGRSVDGIHYGRRWFNALIKAYEADNISVIGEEGAVIDGGNCYDPLGEENYRGPHCICFVKCENVRFAGYTLKDSSNWAHSVWEGRDILCENVTVLAGHDGFDFFASENVTVRDCDIRTGDDCIAGYANRKVLVEDCYFNTSCSVFRFAGNDVLVRNCRAKAPGEFVFRGSLSQGEKESGVTLPDEKVPTHRYNTHSFFTYYADNRVAIPEPPSLTVENLEIDGADKLIHFNFSGNERWQLGRALKSVVFKNVKARGMKIPSVIYGNAEDKVSATFENVEISYSEDAVPEAVFMTANVEKINFDGFGVTGKPKNLIENFAGVPRISCGEISFPKETEFYAEAEKQFSVHCI